SGAHVIDRDQAQRCFLRCMRHAIYATVCDRCTLLLLKYTIDRLSTVGLAMSSSMQCLAEEAGHSHPPPARHHTLVSMPLRGGLEISAVRPGHSQSVLLAR